MRSRRLIRLRGASAAAAVAAALVAGLLALCCGAPGDAEADDADKK